MSNVFGPGDLVLCVKAAPNHVTGEAVQFVAGEPYRMIDELPFAQPYGRADKPLELRIDFALRQTRFRLFSKLKSVSASKEKERV